MQVRYIAKIEVPTTTLKAGSDDQYETVIGTGYPVRDGLVLTAWHVLFPDDRDPDKPIRVIWQRTDEQKPFHTVETFDIPCQEEAFDIALLSCDTSKLTLQPNILVHAGAFPEAMKPWKSYGYPTAGKERGIRIKNPATGRFQPADPDHYVQLLNVKSNAGKSDLWQGMSGAPVFNEAGLLTAVIIKTPAEYLDHSDKDNPKLQPVYKDQLVAASVPYLLSVGKCEKFRKVFVEPERDEFVAQYFESVAVWLNQHPNARKVIWHEVSKTHSDLKECSVSLVHYLKTLKIPALIDLMSDIRKKTTDPAVQSELIAVFKRLLPAFYQTSYVFDLVNMKEDSALVGIPFATQVSAEVLMAATDQRDVDFIFCSVSARNKRQVAYPGMYRLALPPESGSADKDYVGNMLDDDLINRFGLNDAGLEAAGIQVDDYLYRDIAQQSRLNLSRSQKITAIQRELRRLAEDGAGTYYWLFSSCSESEEQRRWQGLAMNMNQKYPEITCLQLEDNFDKEQDEDDLFYKLHKLLTPELQ